MGAITQRDPRVRLPRGTHAVPREGRRVERETQLILLVALSQGREVDPVTDVMRDGETMRERHDQHGVVVALKTEFSARSP